MGVFRNFPYSNFHEMNMDEIIKIIKNMLEEWATYHAEWDSWMNEMEDDWSNYQDVMNEAWENMQNFINNYFDNLDVQEEINNKIVSMIQTGEFGMLVNEYIPPAVSAWLALHITEPTGVVIDTSLSVSGACADAKATGDAINLAYSLTRLCDRILEYGLTPFDGGLNTINASLLVDTRFVYYNSKESSASYKLIMWHNGSNWVKIGDPGLTIDEIPEYLAFININALNDSLSVISKFHHNGVTPYSGGLNAIKEDATADQNKLYYAIVTGANNNRLMYYNGTEWVYGTTFYYYYDLTDGILNTVNSQEYAILIPRFMKCGIKAYNGALVTIQADSDADINQIYYAVTKTANNNRIMYHNGTDWVYGSDYYYNTDLTTGIATGNIDKIRIGTCNFGSFMYGDGETDLTTYQTHYRELFNDANFDFFGGQDWDEYFDENDTIESVTALFGDTITAEIPSGSNNLKAFYRGNYHYIGYEDSCLIFQKNFADKILYIYVGYFQYGEENTAIRAAQYQAVIDNIEDRNATYAIVLGDFNAWSASEYDIWKNADFSMVNCGYLGEIHTLRNLPADNIICTPTIKIASSKFYTDADLNTDHKPIIAELILE